MALPFLSSFSILPYEDGIFEIMDIYKLDNIEDPKEIKSRFKEILSNYYLDKGKFHLNCIFENLFLYNGNIKNIKVYKDKYFKIITWEIGSHLYITGCREPEFIKYIEKLIRYNNIKSKKKLNLTKTKFKVDYDLLLLYSHFSETFYKIIRVFIDKYIEKNNNQVKSITFTGYGDDSCFLQLLAIDIKLNSTIPFFINFVGFETPQKYDSKFESLFKKYMNNTHLVITDKKNKNKSCCNIQRINNKNSKNTFLFIKPCFTKNKMKHFSVYDFANYFILRIYKPPTINFISNIKKKNNNSPPTHMKITKKVTKQK